MYGLVDCNNFYASCERVFRPQLNGIPIVVLSNNDDCVIARSNEAKQIGIKMGVPFYQIKHLIDNGLVHSCSTNFKLYGDMSNRVMNTLAEFTPNLDIYSIDEAFLDLKGIPELVNYANQIVTVTSKNTGIPVCIGIAPTKTLAKLANHFAKKFPGYKRVCMIDSEDKRIKALKLTPIGEVWGIGTRLRKYLESQGVQTAFDFTQKTRAWVRRSMNVVAERMWCELNGENCITNQGITEKKKQILTSRSFGKVLTDYDPLSEAISTFANLCAIKLRKQGSCAKSLMVHISTNRHRKDLAQYQPHIVLTLPTATNDSMEIVHYALEGLKKIYSEGFQYKRAGVMILQIEKDNGIQASLFDTVDRAKQARLMQTMDRINRHDNQLFLAVQGMKNEWKMKQENLSPCYSTRLNDVIRVK